MRISVSTRKWGVKRDKFGKTRTAQKGKRHLKKIEDPKLGRCWGARKLRDR